MKLESKKPAHRTFPSLCQIPEYFIRVDTLVMTYFDWSAIHICNACAFTKSKEFEQQHERYNHPGLQLDKTVVGNGIWKIALHVFANIKQVIILEIMEGSAVEADHHSNNLALGHLRFPVSPFRYVTCLKLVIPDFILIFCTKIVGNTKYFNNFVCCDHRVDVCYLFDYQL
jgi:hypothetical protein